MILAQLFFTFLKIGVFTFGGGYAMLALIQQEITSRNWMTAHEFVDVVGIAEMTPGPIAVNAATFVGYRIVGLQGALVATGAVVLPSLVSVLIVSKVWEKYKNSKGVQWSFAGIRPVIVGLVGAAAIMVGTATLQNMASGSPRLTTIILAIGVYYGVIFKKWNPIKVLLVCAILGLVVFK